MPRGCPIATSPCPPPPGRVHELCEDPAPLQPDPPVRLRHRRLPPRLCLCGGRPARGGETPPHPAPPRAPPAATPPSPTLTPLQEPLFKLDPRHTEDGKGKSPYDPRHAAASVLVGKGEPSPAPHGGQPWSGGLPGGLPVTLPSVPARRGALLWGGHRSDGTGLYHLPQPGPASLHPYRAARLSLAQRSVPGSGRAAGPPAHTGVATLLPGGIGATSPYPVLCCLCRVIWGVSVPPSGSQCPVGSHPHPASLQPGGGCLCPPGTPAGAPGSPGSRASGSTGGGTPLPPEPKFVAVFWVPESEDPDDDKIYFFFRETAVERQQGLGKTSFARIGQICRVSASAGGRAGGQGCPWVSPCCC